MITNILNFCNNQSQRKQQVIKSTIFFLISYPRTKLNNETNIAATYVNHLVIKNISKYDDILLKCRQINDILAVYSIRH